MNRDEFEYFFELEELEPFAGAPLSDLFLNPGSQAPSEVARSRPAGSAAQRTSSPAAVAGPSPATIKHSQPVTARSEHARQPTSPDQDSHSLRQPAGNGDVASLPEDQWPNELPQPDGSTTHSRDRVRPQPESVTPAPLSVGAAAAVSHSDNSGGAATHEQPSRRPNDFEHWQQRMSVHVLGQFAFCNRAGIYSAENGDETDVDEPQPNWGYLPNFDLERIEEQLSKLLGHSLLLLLIVLIFVLAMVGGVAIENRRIFYPALVGAFFAVNSLLNAIGGVLTLLWRRAAARRAQQLEPDPTIDRIQSVNWWSLLKAGFEPVTYQRQFRHPELPLEGSPWRVLERGSLRIPVIKSGAGKLGDAKHTIYPKHELRLAAYAMLLEATEHVRVPYGVIFPADSHLGLAIPITESLREQVVEHLERANDLLVRSQRGESEPRPPADRKRCVNCRLGEPVPISDTEIRGAKKTRIPLLILAGGGDRKYHCLCGDRFGSAPAHRQIIQLGLRSTVE